MKQLLLATAISCAFVAQAFAAPANNNAQNSPQTTAQADVEDDDDNAMQAINMLAANDNMAPAQGQPDQSKQMQQPGQPAEAQPAKILLAGSSPSSDKEQAQKPAVQPGKPAADQEQQPKFLLAGTSPSSDKDQAQKPAAQPAKKDQAAQPEKMVV